MIYIYIYIYTHRETERLGGPFGSPGFGIDLRKPLDGHIDGVSQKVHTELLDLPCLEDLPCPEGA